MHAANCVRNGDSIMSLKTNIYSVSAEPPIKKLVANASIPLSAASGKVAPKLEALSATTTTLVGVEGQSSQAGAIISIVVVLVVLLAIASGVMFKRYQNSKNNELPATDQEETKPDIEQDGSAMTHQPLQLSHIPDSEIKTEQKLIIDEIRENK